MLVGRLGLDVHTFLVSAHPKQGAGCRSSPINKTIDTHNQHYPERASHLNVMWMAMAESARTAVLPACVAFVRLPDSDITAACPIPC